MNIYKDIDNDSGVSSYNYGSDYIEVEFKDSSVYLYNYSKPGKQHIEEMKRLANQGDGLNFYITKYVKKNYYSKVR